MKEKLQNLFTKPWLIIALMAIVSIVFYTQYNANFDRKLDMNGDNMHYFTLAQSLANGDGYVNRIGLEQTPHMHFPPGYPAFMSVLMRLGLTDVVSMKKANGILLCISLLLFFYIVYRLSSRRTLLAFSVTLLAALHPQLLRWSTIMMSEMLFLCVVLLMILLAISINTDTLLHRTGWREWLKVLALLALSSYAYFVRTMGLTIIIAVILWTLCLVLSDCFSGWHQKDKTHYFNALKWASVCFLLIGTFFITRGAWNLRNERVAPGHTSDYVGDFKMKPGGGVMETTEDWTNRIKNNYIAYTTYYLEDALFIKDASDDIHSASAMQYISGILLIIIIAYGLLLLGRGGLLLAIYTAITFCVLLIWPEQYSGIRYFVTLIPILQLGFVYAMYDVIRLVGKAFKKELIITPYIPVLLILILLIPRYLHAQENNRRMAKVNSYFRLQNPPMNEYINAAQWVSKNLSMDQQIMCRKPEVMYMYSNYHHATGMKYYGTEDEILQLIDSRHPDYLLIDWWFPHAYRTYYPVVANHPERFHLVQQFGQYDPQRRLMPTMIFRVIYN